MLNISYFMFYSCFEGEIRCAADFAHWTSKGMRCQYDANNGKARGRNVCRCCRSRVAKDLLGE